MATTQQSSLKILIADDEPVLIEYLKRSLKQDGHSVVTANDGVEASTLLESDSFDVVVLDIIMPHKSGIEVCRQMRASKDNTPVLILSSKEDESTKVAGLDAGADDYMVKPFSYRELSARLRALHRRPTKIADSNLEFHDLELTTTPKKSASTSG